MLDREKYPILSVIESIPEEDRRRFIDNLSQEERDRAVKECDEILHIITKSLEPMFESFNKAVGAITEMFNSKEFKDILDKMIL